MSQDWFSGCLEFVDSAGTTTFRLRKSDAQSPLVLTCAPATQSQAVFREIEDIGSSFAIPILALLALDSANRGDGVKKTRLYDIAFEGKPFDTAPREFSKHFRQNGNRVEKEIKRLRGRIGKKTIGRVRWGYKLAVPVSVPGPDPIRLSPLAPFRVPSPLHFIARPDISEPLIEQLLSNSGRSAITALEGMGGIGKTTLAAHVCGDQRVRQAFPDGIIWLRLGTEPKPTFEDHVKEICEALDPDIRVYSMDSYLTILKNKAVLIVLDNVWDLNDIEPFRLSSGKSRLLFTTQDQSIAPRLFAEKQEVRELDVTRARHLLGSWSGRLGNMPEPYASDILDECGGLALALSMLGAALRNGVDQDWSDRLADLKSARLRRIGRRPVGYKYETLHAAIAVSVNALPIEFKACYLRLAALLEGMPAHPQVLRALWSKNIDVGEAIRLLEDRSLAKRDREGLRLHDLQHKYVIGEHANPTELALVHSALLRSYHVIGSRPDQFCSQMTGRLVGQAQDLPAIANFLKDLLDNSSRPLLRPLWPALDPAGGPARLMLEGPDWVDSMALTLEGKRAICGYFDGGVVALDFARGTVILLLPFEDGVPKDILLPGQLAVSGNGRWAACGRDNVLVVWDLENSREPLLLKRHDSTIWAVGLTPDGKFAISSTDYALIIWDLGSQNVVRELDGIEERPCTVAVASDLSRVVCGYFDGTTIVWNSEGKIVMRTERGNGLVDAFAVSADFRWAISSSDDGNLSIIDLDGKTAPRVIAIPEKANAAVAISANGAQWVAGFDRTVMAWDRNGLAQPRRLDGHESVVRTVAIAPDGKQAASASLTGEVIIWDLNKSAFAKHDEFPVKTLAFTSDGEGLVSGAGETTLIVWDLKGGERRRLETPTPDDDRSVSGDSCHALVVWDLETREPSRLLKGSKNSLNALAIAPGGRFVASCHGSYDQFVASQKLGHLFPSPQLTEYSVLTLALTPLGDCVVVSSFEKFLRVWDLKTGLPPLRLKGHGCPSWVIALSSDGKRVASATDDLTLAVWDLESPVRLCRLAGHTSKVTAVTMTPDGNVAISGDGNGNLIVWDFACKTLVGRLEGHGESVRSVAFMSDLNYGNNILDIPRKLRHT